ncbi:MAG: hypothetical protein IKR81_17305 [Victivallales bacterium]|nr:hypothetical protein [Victivallales bacterium]
MGGLNGIGLGGYQPQIIYQPGVGNVGNIGDLGFPVGPQLGETPQTPEAPEQPHASDVAGQLDVLLLKAVKGVSGELNAEEVAKAANSAKLPRAMKNELKSLAEAAQKSLAALDKFTGKDLAAAMEKKADGTVDWKEGSMAAKSFEEAQNAQEKLSSALAKALSKAKNANTQATLEELMLQCDRRIGEIETLVLQMTEIIDAGGESALDDAAALANDGKLSSFTSTAALDKFGRAEMFDALKSDLKPLTDRLESYANDGVKSLQKSDVEACVKELNAIKAKFSAAAASGSLEIGGKTVFVDRSLLGEASKLLDGVGKKINAIHREVLHAAMVKFVEQEIPFIDEEIFSPKFARELHTLTNSAGAKTNDLEKIAKAHNAFRHAARTYAESPTALNAEVLKKAALNLEQLPKSKAADCMTFDTIFTLRPNDEASNDFRKAFEAFRKKVLEASIQEPYKNPIKKLITSVYDNIGIAAEKLINFGKEFNATKPSGNYFVSGAVLDVFKGEMSLSPLLEARVHGYADSDVKLDLDDKNIASSKTLGNGNFNTVTLVTGKDGSEWVFKPELDGRLTAPNSPLSFGVDANQEMTRINLAVQTTADTLGLDDLMVRTTAGTHKGQFGMFMEKAPGITGKQFKAKTEPIGEPGKAGPSELKQLNDSDFGKVVGRMMRQFNRMQWFDVITGQSDRHPDNYMIDINMNDLSVNIKVIDNDASYGTFRQGLYKFKLDGDSSLASLFNGTIDKIAKGIEDAKDKPMLKQNIEKELGYDSQYDDPIEIDLSKTDKRLLFSGLLNFCGIKNIAPPEEIDKELYDKLTLLAKDAPDGGKARKSYLSSLAERLGQNSAPYKAAVQRLDEAIAHARKLNAEGKVYTADQWEDHDVQRQIAAPNLLKMDETLNAYGLKIKDATAEAFAKRASNASLTNNFFRDFYKVLIKDTSHANWFNG